MYASVILIIGGGGGIDTYLRMLWIWSDSYNSNGAPTTPCIELLLIQNCYIFLSS